MKFLKGFRKGAEEYGAGVGTLVNTVILLIVYVIGIGLTSIAAKLSGKQFLDNKPKKDTYWSEFEVGNKSIQSYYRQF